MFSHPAAPLPPQQPQESKVAGDPAFDADWASAATDWEPETRPESPAQWSWLRWVWEQLDGILPQLPAAPAGAAVPGAEGPVRADEALLDAALALLAAFLQVADGEAEPLSGAEAEAPDASTLRGAAAVARELAGRCGTTLSFAQLWSLARPGELQEDPWAELDPTGSDQLQHGGAADVAGEEAVKRPLFPLSSDDVAWIVSGSMTEAKDRTWRWFSGLAAGPAQG